MYFPETKETCNVEETNPEQMDDCQLNSSNLDSFFEYSNKKFSQPAFLQFVQLTVKTTVQESGPSIWSSGDTTFTSNNKLSDSVSAQWNSVKENSPESLADDHKVATAEDHEGTTEDSEEVTEDHEDVILGSDFKFGPIIETDINVDNYSDNVACYDVETPVSIQTCSDYPCGSDVLLSCCDVLNVTDDLSCSNSWDVADQHSVLNGQSNVRHRNSCLFSVDLCSLVGQRYLQSQSVSSHYGPDDEIPYDVYCQWPMIEDTTRSLRPRPEPYPVMFKREVVASSFTHLYRFTRAEQMEFAQKVGHLVNRRSRKLQRRMKPCSVALSRLPVVALTKYQSCRPFVCLASLSKSVIKRWTKRETVVNSSNKMSKDRKKSGRHGYHVSSSGCPVVPLTRCDFKSTIPGKLFEGQSAKRIPLSCLNRSVETFSVKCSSLGVTSRSSGSASFSQNSLLLYKNLIRKPTILLEKFTGGFNRIKLSNSVSMREGLSNYHGKKRNQFLRMKQTSLNLASGNCVVLLKDLGKKYIKNVNPSSGLAGQNKKMKQMKIDQCFVSLTDCGRKNSVRNARTGCVGRKRRKHSNSRWICVKENHSVLTKSSANSKSVRSNSNGVVLKQYRSNSI